MGKTIYHSLIETTAQSAISYGAITNYLPRTPMLEIARKSLT